MLTEVTSNLKFDTIGVMNAQEAANSSLNPNAPYFFPSAFLEVEDFSLEWWNLVQTSPAFRDYWTQERMQDMDVEGLTAEDFDQAEMLMELMDQEPDLVVQDENLIQKVDASYFEGVSGEGEQQEPLLENSMKNLDLKDQLPEAMQHHDQIFHHNKAPLSPSEFPSNSKTSPIYRI